MSVLRLVESSSGERRLEAALDFLRAVPPGAEVLIVGASRGAADDLARTIALERGAAFGLHRFGFTQLAARTAAAALASKGLAPGTTLAGDAVAARAAFEALRDDGLAYFEPVAHTPGFPRALARTLQELRMAGVGAGALSGLPQAGPDLGRLLDLAEQQFARAAAADRAALFRAAAGVLARPGPSPSALRLPTVLLDVPIESRAEQEFVTALIEAAPSAIATVPAGDTAALDALRPLAARVEQLGEQTSSDLGSLRTYLFSQEHVPTRKAGDSMIVFSAPGEGREAIEIARRILDEAHRGVRFDEMAVLLRAPQSYLGLLEHALRRAGIPAWFDRGTRRPDPAGRAFLALLACAAEGLSARRFAEYLSLGQVPLPSASGESQAPLWVPPTDEMFGAVPAEPAEPAENNERDASDASAPSSDDPDDGDAPAAPPPAPDRDDVPVVDGTLRAPWKWERLLVESAVLGGRDRWLRRLNGLDAEYRVKLQEVADEEPESPRIAGFERELQNLAHLREFALPIIDTMADWPAAGTWGEWLDHLQPFAPRVLRDATRVLEVLADLRPMAAIGPVSLDEARDVLGDRLRTLDRDPPARRHGRVFVGSPHQARGRTFPVVFVPGLAERMFPQKLHEDPLLLDELRVAIDAGLTTKSDRRLLERLLLRLAAGAATKRVYFSYPRLELTESRPRVPSFYLLDLVRAATGRIPNHEDLQQDAAATSQANLAWPAPPDADRAIDDLEHDLAVLRRLLDSPDPARVRGHAHYMLKLNECLRRTITERWARGEKRWSKHDGLMRVTDTSRPALAGHRLAARPYSVSALQRFASCPYQFLLSAVYRLRPVEEPEPIQRLDPLTRGSLFHRVQAEFLTALDERGALPFDQAHLDAALEVLDETLDRVAAEYYDRLAPAIERVWRDEITSMRRDLRVWVRMTADSPEWEPRLFEYSFGLLDDRMHDRRSVAEPVTIAGRFVLRGSVDLVERKRGSRMQRITDHKTGRNRTTPGLVIGGGSVLQPVLYSLAVEAATGDPVVSGRLFYCTSVGGFTAHEIPIDETTRRLGLEALEIIDRSIELGFLAPAPAEGACAFCDFRPVCGPEEERRTRRKPRELLQDLIELRKKP